MLKWGSNLCDPIIDDSVRVEKEPFRKEVVEHYLENREEFNYYPSRHYSQLMETFDPDVVKKLLSRLRIPIVDTHVTVFAGYTGEFASCLRKIGMSVVFTDPLEEWIKKAIDCGFEAYKYAAEEIPKHIVEKTDLFATFEGYIPFIDARTSYAILRFLTSKHGILFGESKRTREELKRERGTVAQMKYHFLPYKKVYSVKRIFRQKDEIRLYRFWAEEPYKKKIYFDCKLMKLIYDSSPRGTRLDKEFVQSSAKETEMEKHKIWDSVKRILNLYRLQIPKPLRSILPSNVFAIFSKRFIVDLDFEENKIL